MDVLECTYKRVNEMFRQPEHMLYKKKLRELSLFNLERRNFRANCPAVYKYLMDGYKEVKAGLF